MGDYMYSYFNNIYTRFNLGPSLRQLFKHFAAQVFVKKKNIFNIHKS